MTGVARSVRVQAPGGLVQEFALTGDDTLVVLVDGVPAVGVDVHGAGHWPDGETWRRLPGAGVIKRSLLVLDMSEQQYHGLAELLGMPRDWFGRWHGYPGETRNISLDTGVWNCGTEEGLDLALAYVRTQGLAYQETCTAQYNATSD